MQLYGAFFPSLKKQEPVMRNRKNNCVIRSLRKYADLQTDCLMITEVIFKSERHIHFSGPSRWKMASWFLAQLDNLIRPGMLAHSPYQSGPFPTLPSLPSPGLIQPQVWGWYYFWPKVDRTFQPFLPLLHIYDAGLLSWLRVALLPDVLSLDKSFPCLNFPTGPRVPSQQVLCCVLFSLEGLGRSASRW